MNLNTKLVPNLNCNPNPLPHSPKTNSKHNPLPHTPTPNPTPSQTIAKPQLQLSITLSDWIHGAPEAECIMSADHLPGDVAWFMHHKVWILGTYLKIFNKSSSFSSFLLPMVPKLVTEICIIFSLPLTLILNRLCGLGILLAVRSAARLINWKCH